MLRRCLLVALPALVVCGGEVREEILVVVNSHIITRRAFQQAVEQESVALYRQFSGKELDDKLRDTRERTLQGLIDAHVIEDKSVDLGIQITDEYLNTMVEGIKQENSFKSDADFEQALRSSLGIGLGEYLKRTRQQMTQQEVLRREVFSRVAVEDQELRAYYEDHKDEYRQPSRFRIRELVLPRGTTPEEQQSSRNKIQEIQSQLKSGKSFEALVKEHSASPTRTLGGDLGWVSKGLLVTSIEEAALALKVEQVSPPIETDKDIYLIQLIASDLDAVKPFVEVKAQILEKLQEPKAQNAIQNYLNGLRVRANIRYMVPKDQILKG
jgi:peptidyl-prolyl cis-trans isomerase SurA